MGVPKNPEVDTFPDQVILDFAGGAALQAVSECPQRRKDGIVLLL